MKPSVAARLLRLNREFYDRFADSFSGSRAVLNPGIARGVRSAHRDIGGRDLSVLDIGCGDGRVGRALLGGTLGPRTVRYVGVDSSSALLSLTGDRMTALVCADLSRPGWSAHAAVARGGFDLALCLAVLHHIPGPVRRLRLLREVRSLLAPDGRLIVSVWRFLHSERLRRRIVPWEEIGLSPEEVDAGDTLLDWRRGGRGLRYVHAFEEADLAGLCRQAGYRVGERYVSDGASGDLGLYFLLAPGA